MDLKTNIDIRGPRPAPAFLDGGPKPMMIGGEQVPAISGEAFETIDPATERVLTTIASGGEEDVGLAVAAARRTFEDPSWAAITPDERGRMLLQIADVAEGHAEELATRRLRRVGSPVVSVLAHPGYAATNLQTRTLSGPAAAAAKRGNALLAKWARGAEAGAGPQLHAATAPGPAAGQFFGPSGPLELLGSTTSVVRAIPAAYDPEVGRRLWEASERLTGIAFPLPQPG